MDKPGWDDYFIGIARAVSVRSSCERRKVGAVIVNPDRRIVGTGYNDSPAGGPHCIDGCPRALSSVKPGSDYSSGPGRCIAIHAEANAIIWAGRDACAGATLYCTEVPCYDCARLIRAAGIVRYVVAPGAIELTDRIRLG